MPHVATLSPLLIAFVATTLFGFVVGLELHTYRRAAGQGLGHGTARTLTLLAVFGFVPALLDSELHLYGVGLLIVGGFFTISYWHRQHEGRKRLLTHLVGLLVYAIDPLALKAPLCVATGALRRRHPVAARWQIPDRRNRSDGVTQVTAPTRAARQARVKLMQINSKAFAKPNPRPLREDQSGNARCLPFPSATPI